MEEEDPKTPPACAQSSNPAVPGKKKRLRSSNNADYLNNTETGTTQDMDVSEDPAAKRKSGDVTEAKAPSSEVPGEIVKTENGVLPAESAAVLAAVDVNGADESKLGFHKLSTLCL